MSVCVGCGLEVIDGILSVDICPAGGIKCASPAQPAPDGCTDGLYINAPPLDGCGLLLQPDGKLGVDPCLNGGILCGATADDAEDDCIYVNVQGQGNAICTPLADAVSCGGSGDHSPFSNPNGPYVNAHGSPNCNGMVRTCEGLWAPPKTFGSAYGATGQDGSPPGSTVGQYSTDIGGIPDVPGSLGDGFPGPNLDRIVTIDPNAHTLFHETQRPDSQECVNVFGNTFGTFSISYEVGAGELWRWLLWERACTTPGFSNNATLATSPCNGTGWALQASFYNDRRGQGASIETVQMNDVSTHLEATFGAPGSFNRWEYMITVQRLVPNAGAINNLIVGTSTRQYRKTTTSSHCLFTTLSNDPPG